MDTIEILDSDTEHNTFPASVGVDFGEIFVESEYWGKVYWTLKEAKQLIEALQAAVAEAEGE